MECTEPAGGIRITQQMNSMILSEFAETITSSVHFHEAIKLSDLPGRK